MTGRFQHRGLSNTIPDRPKQRQPNRHTEVLTIFILIFCSWWCTSVIYCFRKCLKFLGAIIASVLLHNYIWSFDARSLLIGVQRKLELQEKGIFTLLTSPKNRTVKSLEFAINLHQCWQKQYTIDFHTTVTKMTISYPNLKQIFPPLIHENRNKFYCHIQ